MKERVKSLIKHPLVAGSSVIFLGSFGANFINYIFNLSMGRMLSISDYGLLTSLNSLLILVGIFSVSIITIMAKFSAKYYSTDNRAGSLALIRHAGRFVFIFSALLLLVLLALTSVIGQFLHIQNYTFEVLVFIAIFFSMILALPTGFIQGRMQFYFLSGITVAQPLIRLITAVILISLGFSLFGPIVGIALSSAVPAIILYIYLNRRYRPQAADSDFDLVGFKKEFIHYTYTYFLSGIGISLLANTDILLVRHFFPATISGQYAALSLMGKAIFYFTSPIATVFFPLIAFKRERKERLLQTLLLSLGVLVLISGFFTVVYFAFPSLVLRIFFPKPEYKILAQYLGYYSLYILVFAFAALLNSYFLSIGKTKVYIITLIGAVIQIGSILLFHSSIYEIIIGLFSASFIMLLLFLIYYYLHEED